MRPIQYDGTSSNEELFLEFNACVQYHEWDDERNLTNLRHMMMGEVASMLWSRLHFERMSFRQVVKQLKETYGSKNPKKMPNRTTYSTLR